MGQTGTLILFTGREPSDPQETIRAILNHAGAGDCISVTRTTEPEEGWRRFQETPDGNINEGAPFERIFPPPSAVAAFRRNHHRDPPYGQGHTVESAVAAYRPDRMLMVETYANDNVSSRMHDAVAAAIPVALRDGFVPADFSLHVGSHDIYESSEHDDGLYIGRAFISIRFFGSGSPNDWQETRERILALPEVNTIKAEFEEIVGPLEATVMWCV